MVACLIGAAIGFYDGLIGPGTGSFLIIALVSAMGYAFLEASAKAKIVNMATNAGALMFFLPHGSLLWGVGLRAGAGQHGRRLPRGPDRGEAGQHASSAIVFLAVVGALIIKLGYDIWQDTFA